VASGTATLEAALLGVPQAVIYRVKAVTYEVGRRLVKIPRVGLPNVVLGREAVPELIQADFTGPNVCAVLEKILSEGEEGRRRAAALAAEVRNKLGEGQASARAARALVEFVEGVRRPSGPCRP
jgi:lipid-A-disaccharide synthase